MTHSGSETFPAYAIARFQLRGVWVDRDLLGSSATWTHGEYPITLRLPSQPTDFAPLESDDTVPVSALTETATIEGTGSPVSIHLVEVEVLLESTTNSALKERALAARDRGDEGPIEEFQRSADSAWRRGFEVASRAAHGWLQHVRTISGQPWLGTAVEPPLQFGRSAVVDANTNRWLMQFGPLQSHTIRHGALALDASQFERVRELVDVAEKPPVSEQLLADARFLTGEAPTRDHQRAVLSAAAACEIKAKQTIRVATPASRKALTEIVLRKTSSLPDLLDQVALASLDLSLKTDNPDLFRSIQRLTRARNSVVHEGAEVSELDGHQLIVAASQLFGWLDQFLGDAIFGAGRSPG